MGRAQGRLCRRVRGSNPRRRGPDNGVRLGKRAYFFGCLSKTLRGNPSGLSGLSEASCLRRDKGSQMSTWSLAVGKKRRESHGLLILLPVLKLIARCGQGHPERFKIKNEICRYTKSFLHIIFLRAAGVFYTCCSFLRGLIVSRSKTSISDKGGVKVLKGNHAATVLRG